MVLFDYFVLTTHVHLLMLLNLLYRFELVIPFLEALQWG